MVRTTELSRRQQQVLRMAIAGLSNRQIATSLGVTPETVKDHLSAAYLKLGASNRIEAANIALREQLVRLPSDPD
jgi:DNA-binding NarL/FixJ family response regulator